jgi:hypothetical protein
MKPAAALRNSRRFIAVKCLACSGAVTATAVPFGFAALPAGQAGAERPIDGQFGSELPVDWPVTNLLAPLPQAGMAARLQGT